MDGSPCLMEQVAHRAGEPAGDRPRCTHPLLALLAQQVHDRTRPPARAALSAHVEALRGATTRDPRAGRLLVEVVARRVLAAPDAGRARPVALGLLHRADRRATRMGAALGVPGLATVLRAAGPAVAVASLPDLGRALRALLLSVPAGPARDRALDAVLGDAVAAVRGLSGAPGVPTGGVLVLAART